MAKIGNTKTWYLRIIDGKRFSLGPTLSPTPTVTPTATVTPSLTVTASSTVTITPTVTRSVTATPTATLTTTPTTTVTPTRTATPNLTATPTTTRTPTLTITPSVTTTLGGGVPADITTFSVEGTGTQFVTFGHTFLSGDIPNGTTVSITDTSNNIVTTQVESKALHPNGSLRHAVLTAQVTGSTSYKIRRVSPSSGTNKTVNDLLVAVAGDISTVNLTGGVTGTAILRDLLENSTNRAPGNLQIFEQGPSMLGVVVSQNFATHLRVTFHLRWYGGSNLWCDYLFENGYANLNAQNSLQYTAVCLLNGTQVSSNTFNSTTPHYNHTMWHPNKLGFWSSGGTLYVRHNTRYIMDSLAIPNYSLTQVPTSTYLNTLRSTTTPMDNGDYRDNMDSTGADQTIAILPGWEATYFKSSADQRAFNCVLANADGGMAYNFNLLNSVTGLHMNENSHPGTSWNQGFGFGTGVFTGLNIYPDSSVNSHVPSVGYTAYLLTGTYSYMRLMHMWVTFENLWNSIDFNTTFNGMTIRPWNAGSLRGGGWQYRSNGQCAYITPDSHSQKLYFNNWVNGNAAIDNGKYNSSTGTQINSIGAYFMAEGNTQYRYFYHMFFVQSVAHLALDLGFSTLLEVAKYGGKLLAGCMGSTGEFPFESGSTFTKILGPNDSTFYTTFTQVRTANVGSTADSGSQALADFLKTVDADYTGAINEMQTRQTVNDSYFANNLPALSYLERLGVDGGYACFYRTTLSGLLPDFRNGGQFDILPRPVSKPSWVRALAVNAWFSIPNTLLSSVAPAITPPGNSGPISKIFAWGGMTLQTKGSVIRFTASGGHTDYSGNEADALTLNTENPAWVEERAPTTTANLTANAAYNADGRPGSRHVYYDCQINDGLNRVILHGATFVYQNANSFNTVSAYNITTKDYMPSSTYPDSPGAAGVSAKNRNWANEFIWCLSSGSNSTLRRFNPGTGNTTTGFNTGEFGEIYKASAIDPVRNRMLVARDVLSSSWAWYNLNNGTKTTLGTNLNTLIPNPEGSLEWDTIGNRYVFYRNGQEAYAINPTTFIGTAIGATGTPPPDTTPNGLFSRMRFAPELGGIVVASNYGNNVYFLKLYA